jgi:predicted nucleic acid-binding protein
LKVLVDTNVVLDVLLDRKPFSKSAIAIFALIERSMLEGCLCATTVTTIHYLLRQSMFENEARTAVGRLLSLFEIAPVNRPVIERALQTKMSDFEDAVLAVSAELVGASAVITRNTKDFKHSPIKALSAEEFLQP